MHFKKLQQEKKKASKVQRPLPFDQRTPLAAMLPGMEVTGTVISLTKYGAYIDVGTECDGLLHVSQMSRDVFVEHPRQMLSPGEEIVVMVRSRNPSMKKLHLTLLDADIREEESDFGRQANEEVQEDLDNDDRITLDELQLDDELWGEIKRVTDFGGYIEVGAKVLGFLHFMDHPSWEEGQHPAEFMSRGHRIRIWVSDVDHEQQRLKLTGNRPSHLPGLPRRPAHGQRRVSERVTGSSSTKNSSRL